MAEGHLSIKIKLGGPPGGDAVLQFAPEGVKVGAAALRAVSRKIFNLEAARLFQVMVVSHNVRAFLGRRRSNRQDECAQKQRGKCKTRQRQGTLLSLFGQPGSQQYKSELV